MGFSSCLTVLTCWLLKVSKRKLCGVKLGFLERNGNWLGFWSVSSLEYESSDRAARASSSLDANSSSSFSSCSFRSCSFFSSLS